MNKFSSQVLRGACIQMETEGDFQVSQSQPVIGIRVPAKWPKWVISLVFRPLRPLLFSHGFLRDTAAVPAGVLRKDNMQRMDNAPHMPPVPYSALRQCHKIHNTNKYWITAGHLLAGKINFCVSAELVLKLGARHISFIIGSKVQKIIPILTFLSQRSSVIFIRFQLLKEYYSWQLYPLFAFFFCESITSVIKPLILTKWELILKPL